MQFTINREALLKPLQLVTAVIERRQTVPILANIFLNFENNILSLLGTDMEVELAGRIVLDGTGKEGKTTAPARKLVDICKNLPEKSCLKFNQKEDKLVLQCDRSRFNLMTLPANNFPIFEESFSLNNNHLEFSLSQKQLLSLIDATNFAMAQQDVRYYLNGMLWELEQENLRVVATDGHRLATSIKNLISYSIPNAQQSDIPLDNKQFIIPRKAIYELSRLLNDDEKDDVKVLLNNNQLRVNMPDYTFTSKLIDGKFPNYDRVIPQRGDKTLTIDRDLFKYSLLRVGILSNDKHKYICLEMKNKELRLFANNLDQEDAEDILEADYIGEPITIALNINYLIDVLNSLPQGQVKMTLTSTDASIKLESVEGNTSIYVIMPMRL